MKQMDRTKTILNHNPHSTFNPDSMLTGFSCQCARKRTLILTGGREALKAAKHKPIREFGEKNKLVETVESFETTSVKNRNLS